MIKEEPHWLQNITTIDYSMKMYNILNYIAYIEITSWLVSAYDFYSRVVKDR